MASRGFRLTPGRAQDMGSRVVVEDRVVDAQSRRLKKTLDASRKELNYVYDQAGRIRPIGGRAYPAKAIQTNSGMGRGDPVQVNQGLVSATPSSSALEEMAATLAYHGNILETLPQSLGVQWITGDPNEPNSDGFLDFFPRVASDMAVDQETGASYYWNPNPDSGDDPRWEPVPILAGLKAGIVDPNDSTDGEPGTYEGQTYFDFYSGTLFRWDADADASAPNPSWVPVVQVAQRINGDPNDQGGNSIPIFLDGALAVNTEGQIYVGDISTGAWTKAGGGVITLAGSPTDAGTPVAENLLVIDKTTGDQWYADDSDPQVWAKQPDGTLITGQLDPNSAAVESPIGAFYWQLSGVNRMFVKVPRSADPNASWWAPVNNRIWHEGDTSTNGYTYAGDLYQDSNNMIYIWLEDRWNEQFFCPDCAPPPSGSWIEFLDPGYHGEPWIATTYFDANGKRLG